MAIQRTSTDELAEFAATLSIDQIPTTVREHAKLSLLDTLGCGLFGSALEWSRILSRTMRTLDTSGSCQEWGTTSSLTAPTAALLNGTAVHGFELDDLHPRSILHVGSVTVPAAMAVAEQTGVTSGERLLTAIIAGYEVGARVGMAVGAAHLLAGWHPTGTHGTFAAAAAAAVMLGLDSTQTANALGIAGTQSAGLMASQYGSMVKRFHAGRAAQSGVLAAFLAQAGFTGIEDVLESPYGGYCTTMSPTYDPEALRAGLGETWETAAVGFKPYSTNGSCHAAIDALLELRRQHQIDVADVASVTINVSSATKAHVGWRYRPTSVTAAQMNLPYIVGVVLTDGAAFVDQFTPERITSADLVEFTNRVDVIADPAIDAKGNAARHETEVRITLADGAEFAAGREWARGSAHEPLSTTEIESKFDYLATRALSTQRAENLKVVVQSIEHSSLDELSLALKVTA
jgi:2-methylcitrate dehydratase PrpD